MESSGLLLSLAIGLIVILMVSGAPMFTAFCAGSLIIIFLMIQQPPQQLAGQMIAAVNKYPLLAIPFFILTFQHPCIGYQVIKNPSGKFSVMVILTVFNHIEINRTIYFVCESCIQDIPDHLDLLNDMA